MGLKNGQNRQEFSWAEEMPAAVTVCDMTGTIIAMNRRARENFKKRGGGKLIGTSLFDCHAESSNKIIRRLLATGEGNVYAVQGRKGRRLIQQMPWYREEKMAGLVEIITPLSGEIALKDRT